MNRLTKFVAVPIVMGLLLLATAAPAFAEHGPAFPAATPGVGNALGQVMDHAADKGANESDAPPGAPGAGTHTAVGRVAALNPAVDACELDPECP